MEKHEYYKMLAKLGIISRTQCDREESKYFDEAQPENIPDDVCAEVTDYAYMTKRYYRYAKASDAEIANRILLLNAKNIKIIKSCVIFFTVLLALGLAANLIAMLM